MQIRTNHFLIISLIGILFWQCSETKEVNPDDLGSKYFPLNAGDFRVYQVDGVRYYAFNDSVAFSYLLKETVTDSFTNLESGISYRIQRQKKQMETETWEIDSIWTARKDERTAISVENNVPTIKLSFPLQEGKTWDGNRINDKPEDEYEMINLQQVYSFETITYDNTITVIQEYIPDIVVNTISKKEVYSENTGLVYKENIILNYRQDDDLGKEIIDNGIKYYQYLIDYGKD